MSNITPAWPRAALLLLVCGALAACSDTEMAALDVAAETEALALPSVPAALIAAGGELDTQTIEQSSCAELRGRYGISYASSSQEVDASALQPLQDYTCAEFDAAFLGGDGKGTATLQHSVRLTEKCTFSGANILIAASNVQLRCNHSTFDGLEQMKYGLRLPQRSNTTTASASMTPIIRNVSVDRCTFQNFTVSGVYLTNRYNRHNADDQLLYDFILGTEYGNGAGGEPAWDLPGTPSWSDYLRDWSPSGFYLGDITVKNTRNAAIYIHDHLHDIDINRLHAINTRIGVYLEHGSRDNTVRNSCFHDQNVSAGSPREYIAIDSSARNRIESNLFYRNHYGAVRLYKNCSEHALTEAHQFFRRQHANLNTIGGNVIVGGDTGEFDYAGISIASRQWSPNTDKECGDASVSPDPDLVPPADPNDLRYRDYAEQNVVVANVFFAPGLGVSVKDDRNTVYANVFYTPRSHVEKAVRVGQARDLTYGRSALRDNVAYFNQVLYQDSSATPSSVPTNLFQFLGESAEYTLFAFNSYQSEGICRAPFHVQSTNVTSEACRFGSLDSPALYLEGDPVYFSDGGRIHGNGFMLCRSGYWETQSGYCCSGTSQTNTACPHESIAGNIYY